MQEVTTAETRTATIFDQLRSGVLVDSSSKSRAFSDFLGLMAQSATAVSGQQDATFQINAALDATAPLSSQAEAGAQIAAAALGSAASAVSDAADTADVQANVPASVQAAVQTSPQAAIQAATQSESRPALNTKVAKSATGSTAVSAAVSAAASAKNVPVSREAFEEAKPLLLKAGCSDKDIAELSAQVQAGSLTWGQLIQNLGSRMTGAKKAVNLSADEAVGLQSLFQKMGFASESAAQMVKSVAKGDGLSVLSNIQNKLSTQSEDNALGMDKSELATFFKAMGLPDKTAQALTAALGPESTVADMKNALAAMGQSLTEQRAKTAAADAELAKNLGKVMEKDVAKHSRDTTQTLTETAQGSSRAEVAYELKTKDRNDTSWFDQREQKSEQQASQQQSSQQSSNQQSSSRQKASDDSWRGFNSKVRAEDAAAQNGQAQAAAGGQQQAETGKASLDGLSRAGQAANQPQAGAQSAQQAKGFEKVAAPKVLDQITEAAFKDLGQGRKQMTIQLDPENLGKAQVILQVKGKEVSALIQVDDAQTAAMLSSNMDSLKKSLEAQGLTVQNLEVQTGLASRQDQQAFSPDQHNQAQEQQELSRLFSQLRMMRSDGGDMAPDMQNMHMRAILADQGLHIVA